jgi:hypothetical protein
VDGARGGHGRMVSRSPPPPSRGVRGRPLGAGEACFRPHPLW